MDPIFEKNLITTKDAGELFGYSSDYLARLARSGKIAGRRIGHSWFVEKESLSHFLDQQGIHKVDYARALSREREIEYKKHHSVIHNVEKKLSKPISLSTLNIKENVLFSQFVALSVSFFVVAAGAYVAYAAPFAQLATDITTITHETAFGFNATFGNIPSRIASRINDAKNEMNAVAPRVAMMDTSASLNLASLALIEPDLSSLQMAIADDHSYVATRFENEDSTATVSVPPARISISSLYSFVTHPSQITDSFVQTYLATGENVYSIINASPDFITQMNLAFGNAIITATHSAIRFDVALAYGTVATAPALAQKIFDAEYAGASRFVAFVNTGTEHYALALRNLGEIGYEGAANTRSLARVTGSFISNDTYLGALGKTAVAWEGLTSLSNMLAAVAPTLSTAERLALATYETIHGFINATGSALAFLFTPSPSVVTPVVIQKIAVSTSTPSTPSIKYATSNSYSYPTYTTVVQGISEDFLNQSLASLRLQSRGSAENAVQSTSRSISALFNKGIVITDGTSIEATTGDFTNFTAGTATLGATTVTGSIINTSTATSTFAGSLAVGTSTPFGSGLFIVGTSTPLLYVSNNTGNVGIGISSPAFALDVNGIVNATSLYVDGVPYIGSQWTTVGSSIYYSTGNVGIGTTSPYSLFSLSNSASTLANTPLFTIASTTAGTATSTLMTILASGRIGIGTAAPDASALLDITSTTGGILPPRLTTVQKNAISSPAAGLTLYDSTLNKLNVYNGSAWKNVGSTEIGGEVTNGVLGSILFIGDGTILGQDNANFNYSTSTGRLGIGTTSPFASLSIAGTAGGITNLFALSTSTSLFSTTTALTINQNGDVSLLNGTNLTLSALGTAAGAFLAADSTGKVIATTTSQFLTANQTITLSGAVTGTGTAAITTAFGSQGAGVLGTAATGVPSMLATSTIFGGIATFLTTGNVGIGSTSPNWIFSVNGPGNGFAVDTTGAVKQGTWNGTAIGVAYGGTGLTSGYNNTNWDTAYTNRITSTSFPLSISSNVLSFNGLSTSTAAVVGNIPYFSGANTFANVATSTPSLGLGLSYAGGTLGSFVGGTAGTFTIATSSLYSGATGQFPYFSGANTITATSSIFLATSGNVGIGTTTPNWLLQVSGTRPSFALSDYSASSGNKHWLFSSMGGNLYIGTSTDAFSTSTPSALTILNNGNVGIGTSSPTTYKFSVNGSASLGSGDEAMRVGSTGNIGIGTTSPYAKLSLVDNTASLRDVFTISTTTSGAIFRVDSYGRVYGDGASYNAGADYAEYFYTNSVDLQPGEIVCVDIVENNAVKRCARGADNNVMGIVSSKPSFVGNYTKKVEANPSHYAIIGMMGQVEAFASAENGAINIGDSLTSASSTPGYTMRADNGDSTVAVALEPLKEGAGTIKVLISRRNKSMAVEEVESLVVERIANMKIEDSVQQLVKEAIDTIALEKLSISGAVFAGAYETAIATSTGFIWGSQISASSGSLTSSTTITAEIPSAVLTADGKGVDIYKLATYTLSGVQALIAKIDAQEIHLASLEDRVMALEDGTISSDSSAFSTTSLASAFEGLGVFIQKGFAQFGTLVADQFVAATNSAGSSSAGAVTILAGNTVAQVSNAFVKPSSKIFVTLTASTTGSWYISDKQNGSFKLVLENAQPADVSFDYFLVQTEGQMATSTPSEALGSDTPKSDLGVSLPSAGADTPTPDTNAPENSLATSTLSLTPVSGDTTPPVVTLIGDAAMQINVNDAFTDSGATATDGILTSDASSGSQTSLTVVVTGTVDTATAGLYTLTYTATDAAGNVGTVSRVVTVLASTPSTDSGQASSPQVASTEPVAPPSEPPAPPAE